eukprot:Pompholyxophrys_punicea_v1_NODE_34_length_4918_cov_64.972445.p3 type:complete len:103 gc:universal NODE_34_length_4918_cov_64.972445:1906-2214(+)
MLPSHREAFFPSCVRQVQEHTEKHEHFQFPVRFHLLLRNCGTHTNHCIEANLKRALLRPSRMKMSTDRLSLFQNIHSEQLNSMEMTKTQKYPDKLDPKMNSY